MKVNASINEVSEHPWQDDLPDIPMFLHEVRELACNDALGDDQRTALIEAIEAVNEALRTNSDEALNTWGETYHPEWGQS
jgi:hypothetical protein